MSDEWKNLGWQNGWQETPLIVQACREAGHTPVEVNCDQSMHGYEHHVSCPICKYFYRVDSSG
jgi:hypothetical protein